MRDAEKNGKTVRQWPPHRCKVFTSRENEGMVLASGFGDNK